MNRPDPSGGTEPAAVESLNPATLSAAAFVALYSVLLLCIPTRLVVGAIGDPGAPANLLAMLGLLWWLCGTVGGQLHRGLTPARLTVAFFASMVLASFAAGHLQGWYQPADIRPRFGATRWYVADVPEMTTLLTSAADRGLLALAGWVGIALLTADGLRSWGDLNKAINWLVGAATVVAVVGVIQYFTGLDISGFISIPGLSAQGEFGGALSRSDLNRIVSTSAHPIELGVAMAAMLPLAIHVGFRDKTAPSWLPALAIGLASLMTVSRSAVIVAAAAMVVLILGWPARLRIMALILVPIFGVVGPVVLPGLLGTIRALFTNLGNDPSIEGRTSDYGLVTRLVLEQPFFGRGLFAWVPDVYRTLDNQVLVLLLEVGIVGALAFFIMAGAGVVQGILVRLRAKDEVQRNAGLSISASLVGISMSFVTFDALGFRQVAGLTFLLIGLGGAIKAISDKDADSPTDAV